MKKPGFPIWLVAVLVLLIGGIVVVTAVSNKNVQTFADHDHDHDGKADHGDDVKH
jgi:hypothetical protein